MVVDSQNMAEAKADDAIVTTTNVEAPGPSDKPKSYMVKLFSKLSETEKWEVSYDMIDGLMKRVWEEPDAEFDALELYKKKSNEFLNKHLQVRKVCSYPVAPKYQGGNQVLA